MVVMMAEKPVDESRWWRERGNAEQGGTGMRRGGEGEKERRAADGWDGGGEGCDGPAAGAPRREGRVCMCM